MYFLSFRRVASGMLSFSSKNILSISLPENVFKKRTNNVTQDLNSQVPKVQNANKLDCKNSSNSNSK